MERVDVNDRCGGSAEDRTTLSANSNCRRRMNRWSWRRRIEAAEDEDDPCVGSSEEELVCRVENATCVVDWSVSP